MLSPNTIQIVKSTVPLLESADTAITDHFYQRMFHHNPELKNTFNMSNQQSGAQQFALFAAIAMYAKNIDNLEVLTPLVERVAHKHTSYLVKPEEYAIVGHHLIETLREIAPEAFTPEVEEAWTQAYHFLANILSGKESTLYDAMGKSHGGWKGTRQFIVKEKIPESELVTSFILVPEDNGAIADFTPGQYLGITVKPKNSEYQEIRQYSLSDKPNGRSYRISVKKESAPVAGLTSSYLHDVIQVGDSIGVHPPAGVFCLHDSPRPAVLISAGVGATPMMAMLESIISQSTARNVCYLHACENALQHSFADRISQITESRPEISSHYWYNQGSRDPQIFSGLMNLDRISEKLPINTGYFYICGPSGFMKFIKQQLLALGVAEDHIFYEVFGPHADL